MKTFIEVCEIICGEMQVTCIVADLDEANLLIDRLKKSQLPVLIIIPYEAQDAKTPGGLIKTNIPFDAFLLDRDVNQKTVDFSYNEVYKKIVEPMRGKGRDFVNRMNHWRDSDSHKQLVDQTSQGIVNVQYIPTYSSGDASLHGVNIKCQIPVIEDINGCIS